MIDKMQQHFGFTTMPFARDLAPAMLHRHASHAEAAARITWTITEKTLGVITGEVGTGKTVAARAALAALDPTRHTVIYIGNPATGVRGIHHHIVTSLGGRPAHGTATLTAQAYDVLAGEAAERGRTPVLIIDEAHLLSHDQLESVRMLTNHDMDSRTPFATVLIGQPTLRRMIKLGVLAALDQRIAVRYQMTGMTPAETGSYTRHHLQLAGRDGELFSDDAITQIHDAGRGKPRAVNNLAIAALIATYATGKKIVDQSAARAAISEVISAE
jgi:type II secretory pathway predicted ATPase ExeA